MNSTVVEELPIQIQNNSVLSINDNNVSHLTHGIHKYPGKFIPQIPEWVLKKYCPTISDGFVLDPFCGSGTTLLECILKGVKSIGIDIDPLSCLISKVKTTPIQNNRLEHIKREFSNLEDFTETKHVPKIDNLRHWFSDDAIDKISKVRTQIENLQNRGKINKDEYDFLIVIFSSIIRRVSNADNRSQKTYVSHTRFKEPAEVFKEFRKNLESGINDLKRLNDKIDREYKQPIIINKDIESLKEIGQNYDVNLMITSPPYIKSIDYIYNQMAELFWVGDLFELETQPKQNKKKREYLGAKNILKKEYSSLDIGKDQIGISELDENIKKIYMNDKKNGEKHSYIVYKFFSKMKKHLETAYKALNTNGNYIIIVGNSSVSNYEINTADFILKLAEQAGFRNNNFWSYEIRNRYMGFDRKGKGGLINHDHVIELEK